MSPAPRERAGLRTPSPGSAGSTGRAASTGHAGDRAALGAWLGSRLLLALVTLAGAVAAVGAGAGAGSWLARWDRWDVGLFRKVAEHGYGGYPDAYPDVGTAAFFPGLPLVLRAVHAVVPDWTAAGLLVSLVAGGVAAVALGRLAESEDRARLGAAAPAGPTGAGRRAVWLLALSPVGVFLAAGYSEALFLAFALPAWLAARERRWAAAGLLAAAAAGVRVTGLFLAAALVVEFLVARRDPRGVRPRLREGAWLLAPLATVAAYVTVLAATTGDWLAWPHAQEAGWGRRLTDPVTALATTLRAAAEGDHTWAFRGEVAAVALGVGLVAVLVAKRRWAEAVYVGLSVAALATSTSYLSVPRAALLWWPLWVGLALATRRRPVLVGYLVVAVPLWALVALAFTSGRWVG